jgi:hypothetical protein
MKWLFRILLAPIMLALKVIILAMVFLLSISTSLLSILASLLGLMAVLVFFVVSKSSGIWLLVVSWLISPCGIPMAADWIINRMDDLWVSIQEAIYQ